MSLSDLAKANCNSANDAEGNLKWVDCPICKNKGSLYWITEDERVVSSPCTCMKARETRKQIHLSGLEHEIEKCTFDSYETEEDWQKQFKEKAMEFLNDCSGKWFYIGGQSGGGKTHLCTAMVGELIEQGKQAKYMLWRDHSVKLKSNIMDRERYEGLIQPFKEAEVLYIDDLFKTGGKSKPSDPDIGIAFEILNYRYNNPKLITILSGELFVEEIAELDQAVGGRIYERSRDYCLSIPWDGKKNYRFKR